MSGAFGVAPLTLAGWMGLAVGVILLALLVLAAVNRVLLKVALRNVPRRRAQTVLILCGLMLATLIFTTSLAVGDTFAYTLQAAQTRQLGGIDEGFTRHTNYGVPFLSTREADFFSEAQAQDMIARSLADPNVAAAEGVIEVQVAIVDTTTSQTAAQNVALFGVPPDFHLVWGPLHSRSGANLDVAALKLDQVYIGNKLADRLNARAGDDLRVYVDGHPTEVTVRQVLDTEINPHNAWTFMNMSSVLMPLASLRRVINHLEGYNLILLHNHGDGGVDDLGPAGATSDEIKRRMRVAFTDPRAAAELKFYLNTRAIKVQLARIRDQATFIDPDKDAARKLLVALEKPGAGDTFVGLAGDYQVRLLMTKAVDASIPKSAGEVARKAAEQDLNERLASLQVDSAAAAEMKTLLDKPEILLLLRQIAANLPPAEPAAIAIIDLVAELERNEATPKFKSRVGNPDLQQELAATIGELAPTQLARFNEIAGRLDLPVFSTYKADAVLYAQIVGLVASAALAGVSFFSVAVGVLLIFVLFVMLAAERRAEMGISRAVGLKRRHLIQVFLFEGMAYTLFAGIVGVVLGVLVGQLMIGVGSSALAGIYNGLELQYHAEWTSLVISFCLGILFTFLAVAFSAYKVSRVNIVAAIRDLDEGDSRDTGLLRMFIGVFGIAWFALRQLRLGHPLVFLVRFTLGTAVGVRTLWWALFRRGPMTIALGLALVLWAVRLAPVVADGDFSAGTNIEAVYAIGVSLIIVGAGLLIKWAAVLAGARNLVAARIGYTTAALGLLIYWARPFGSVERLLHIEPSLQLSKLVNSPFVVAISALMVLLAAIWLVIYNSDVLIRGVMYFTDRIGSLAPVTRTSMAYPMATKFRTGMAVAMFAIVTVTIVYMSVFKDVLTQNFGHIDTGAWQIVAGSPARQAATDTTFPADPAALVRADSTVSAEVQAVGWENADLGAVLYRFRPDGSVNNQVHTGYRPGQLHVVDDGYLSSTGHVLQHRAAGYASDRAVWEAVRDRSGYAVIGAVRLPSGVLPVKTSEATFEPFQMQLSAPRNYNDPTAKAVTVTVVGYYTQAPGNWTGVYVSTRTALSSGFFAPATVGGAPSARSLGAPPSLSPTGYYFMLRPGVDVERARLDLGRLLVKYRIEPIIATGPAGMVLALWVTLLNLITGFLALGLIVGIAGLGVISTRAVVERLQQIGMLRALGYRRSLVQSSFLMESSLVAILGLVIGATIGVWESYRFFVTNKAFGDVTFNVPVVEIVGILLLAYLATLLTTYLPARAASRVAPAEALRYE